MANPRNGPSHALLEKAEGVFQVEAPCVRAPDEIQIRHRPLRTVPPQPQHPRLAPPLASGQTLDLDQDERAYHDPQRSPSTLSCVVTHLRVHLGPCPNAHRSVTVIFAVM